MIYSEIEVGGVSKALMSCNFFAIRKRDARARAVSNTAWTIRIALHAFREEVFTEWMIDPTKKKDITIRFMNADGETKEWFFINVFCIGFDETYIEDVGYFQTVIILTGQGVTNGNATIEYDWGS
ncbi:hypothetical protein GCM10027299_10760 [Larkinella ripae]